MSYQYVFKRYEIKYLISRKQKEQLLQSMQTYMQADAYGRSTIGNIYFDTSDFLLIRRSIEKPVYKEKLRLRSYGVATPDSPTFVELKKKYQSIVYKRRIEMPEQQAMRYLAGKESVADTQIAREINYTLTLYAPLQPIIFLSYEREAFYGRDDHAFRVTFDENILWRNTDLSLCKGIYGTPILQSDQVLMEIKTSTSIPLWMVTLLSENHMYKTSFSKYGNAYQAILAGKHTGGMRYA